MLTALHDTNVRASFLVQSIARTSSCTSHYIRVSVRNHWQDYLSESYTVTHHESFGDFSESGNCLISHSTATQRRSQSMPLLSVLLRIAWGTWSTAKGQALPDSRSPGPPWLPGRALPDSRATLPDSRAGPLHSLLAVQVSLHTSGLRSTATEPQKNVQTTKTEESTRYTVNGENASTSQRLQVPSIQDGSKDKGGGVMSAGWVRHPLLPSLIPHPNSTLTSIHPQTKMPWRRCGVRYLMPRNLGEVSPSQVPGN